MSLAENLAAVRAVDRKSGARPVPVIESKNHLKSLLVVGDSIALLLAWSIAVSGWNHADRKWWVTLAIVPAMTLNGLWVQSAHSLYLARVCNIRLVEMSKVMRSAGLIAVCGLAASRVFKVTLPGPEAVVGAILTLLFLIVCRSTYRAWLYLNDKPQPPDAGQCVAGGLALTEHFAGTVEAVVGADERDRHLRVVDELGG